MSSWVHQKSDLRLTSVGQQGFSLESTPPSLTLSQLCRNHKTLRNEKVFFRTDQFPGIDERTHSLLELAKWIDWLGFPAQLIGVLVSKFLELQCLFFRGWISNNLPAEGENYWFLNFSMGYSSATFQRKYLFKSSDKIIKNQDFLS